MREKLLCCIGKDIKECVRTGKLIIMEVMILGLAVMIMGFTVVFSNIPEVLWEQLEGFDIGMIEQLVSQMYPKILRENMAIYAYYLGLMFSIVVILMTNGMLPGERDTGRWILPMQHGYEKRCFLGSKIIVYGTASAASVFVGYLLYYFIAWTFMERNMSFGNALICALVHACNLFFIVAYTFLFSMFFKSSVFSAVSMILTIMLMPDIVRYFGFGKYLPFYLLTFVYDSSDRYSDIPVPFVLNVFILLVLYIVVSRKSDEMPVA